MRILHILDHSLPLHSGYTFRTLEILNQQRQRGWETFHLTSPKHGPSPDPVQRIDGWDFFRSPMPTGAFARLTVGQEILLMRNLARRLDEVVAVCKPDVLHAHSPVLNALPTLWVGRRRQLPVVYEVRAFWEDAAVSHGTGQHGGMRYAVSRMLETYALRHADAVTTICEGLRDDIVARGVAADNVTVIPNAVDTQAFSGRPPPDPALIEKLGLAGKVVLGFLGSYYRYEGLHILLEAMKELSNAEPRVHLLLVGGGPEESNLKQLAAQLGVEPYVTFIGRVPHGEVQKYYDLIDIAIFPREAIRLTELVTPLKPLEAMALRKIVVASNVGGHRELIENQKTGYLFPPDDPHGLATCVTEVVRARASWPAMHARARHFVEAERTWEQSVGRYEGVYRRLLKPRSGS